MSNRFDWKAEYEIGDERVDREHQELLALARLLEEANERGLAHEVVDQAVQALLDYVDYHFRDEEEYLHSTGSPFLQAHRQEHLRLAEEIAELAEERDLGFICFECELLKWLQTRLVPHMTHDDMVAFGKGRHAAPSAGASA